MRMSAEPVFLNGIELMLAGLRTAASSIEVLPGQRVIVVPHQPSGKLLKALVAAARVEFPGFEYLNNLKNYGNTISSSEKEVSTRMRALGNSLMMAPLATISRASAALRAG